MQKFRNQEKVVDRIVSALNAGETIGVYGDHDVDGLMSLLTFKELFNLLDYGNVCLYPYAERTHNIEPGLLNYCLVNRVDLVIICDTGSSDLDLLNCFNSEGIDCIVLDHHTTVHNYEDFPDNVTLINTILDLKEGITNVMCGGGISFAVASATCRALNKPIDKGCLGVFAFLAQYADAIPMDTQFGRYLYDTVNKRQSTPKIVELFFRDGKSAPSLNPAGQRILTKRFAQYTFAPRVNAAFRLENFQLLFDLFVAEKTNKEELFDQLFQQHANTIKLVNDLIDKVHIEIINNIVVANLSTLHKEEYPPNFLVNHKGRVANSLSTKYKRACVCVCDDGTQLQGSLRDVFGRDLLQYFVGNVKCGGHKPAFGFSLPYKGWDSFIELVGSIVFEDDTMQNDNCVVSMPYGLDVLRLSQIALDNEFATSNNTATYVRFYLKTITEATKFGYAYLVWTDGVSKLWAASSKQIKQPGYVTLYPYLSNGTKVELYWEV